jgi:hypothetical protein
MKILHEQCDPKLANDRSLPYNSFLVLYEVDNSSMYDIVICDKRVEIFDYYWDKYREKLKSFKQTEGRINPRLWSGDSKKDKKKK